jgi:hypothetical protein
LIERRANDRLTDGSQKTRVRRRVRRDRSRAFELVEKGDWNFVCFGTVNRKRAADGRVVSLQWIQQLGNGAVIERHRQAFEFRALQAASVDQVETAVVQDIKQSVSASRVVRIARGGDKQFAPGNHFFGPALEKTAEIVLGLTREGGDHLKRGRAFRVKRKGSTTNDGIRQWQRR